MNQTLTCSQKCTQIHYIYRKCLNRLLIHYAVSELTFLQQLPSHHAVFSQLISRIGVLLHEERQGGWNTQGAEQYLSRTNSLLQPLYA